MNTNEAGQMLRGSSAIRGVMDSHLFLRKLNTKGSLLAEHDKSRHAETVTDFIIKIADPDDSDTITTVVYDGDAGTSQDKMALADAFVLRLLADNGPMNRKQIIEHGKAQNLKQRTICQVLAQGIGAKILSKQRRGKDTLYSVIQDEELLSDE
jgi:hypothetical protein